MAQVQYLGERGASANGNQSNPVLFAESMLEADKLFGPFQAVVGHSMGGGAAIYAIQHGLRVNKLVAISSPGSFFRVLQRFAFHIGFSARLSKQFFLHAEKLVGVPFANIESAELVGNLAMPALFIHDQQDLEIPHSESSLMAKNMPNASLLTTEGLGHRKIMRSERVIEAVSSFIDDGNLHEEIRHGKAEK